MTQNILYINIDDLDHLYGVFKDDIEQNNTLYQNEINNNDKLKHDYDILYKNVIDVKDKYQLDLANLDKEQKGGSAILISSLTTTLLTGLLSFMLWLYYRESDECKKQYELYPRNKIPDVAQILGNIVPSSLIKDKLKIGKNVESVLDNAEHYLESMVETFSIFDENVGSTFTKATKMITKIGLSVGTAVVTAGLGSGVVNIPFFMAKAINMTAKTFLKIKSVTSKIKMVINKLKGNIIRAKQAVRNINNKVNKQYKNMVNEFRGKKAEITFIYDLFHVDFRGGPFHNQCWVNYIMDYYMKTNDRVKEMYSLLCVMNDIYVTINDQVIRFIGASIDVLIPYSIGMAGIITPLLSSYSYEIYRGVRTELADSYKSIPIVYRKLIENPPLMKKYIFGKMNTFTLGLSDQVIPQNVKSQLGNGIDFLANGVNKGMSMLFMFLNVFIIFSEMNAGVNKSLINKNINMEKLLKNCSFCGTIQLRTTDINRINLKDVNDCNVCKRFFLEDPNVEISNKALINKCRYYILENRDPMKIKQMREKIIKKMSRI